MATVETWQIDAAARALHNERSWKNPNRNKPADACAYCRFLATLALRAALSADRVDDHGDC